jgi:hypothetical protein
MVFSIQLPPSACSVYVPPDFFEPGKYYKVEIIAQETSGNRACGEMPFVTTGR